MPDLLLGIYRSESGPHGGLYTSDHGPHGESARCPDNDDPLGGDIGVALAKECRFNGDEIGGALNKEDRFDDDEDIFDSLQEAQRKLSKDQALRQ